MEKAKPRLQWIRGAAASVCVLFVLAIAIPNLTSVIGLSLYVALLLVPLACIHFGARKFRALEAIGWFLLVVLCVLVTQK